MKVKTIKEISAEEILSWCFPGNSIAEFEKMGIRPNSSNVEWKFELDKDEQKTVLKRLVITIEDE